ncbi:hypothetical protein GM3708_1554 [Geminocystis sp. NIES-3708]|nr:hypothetical protein GM3708_1554 [Geminocystis sp. NIES-3708]
MIKEERFMRVKDTMEDALADLEVGITQYLEENGIDLKE